MRAVFLICVSVVVVVGQDINEMMKMPKYDSRYDYLDVDAVLDSKRLVRNYVECLINSARCTPEGKALKRILPEALRTKCVRCTEKQKRTAVKVIRRIKYEYPAEWDKLQSRWDPTGDFTRYFEEYLAKEKFNTIPDSGTNEIPSPSLPPSPPVVDNRPQPPPVTEVRPQPEPTPVVLTVPMNTQGPQGPESTTYPPMVVNRFGADGELMVGSPSSAAGKPRSTTNTMGTSSSSMYTTMATMQTSGAPEPKIVLTTNPRLQHPFTSITRVQPSPSSTLMEGSERPVSLTLPQKEFLSDRDVWDSNWLGNLDE